jgi:hypothetical protein
MAVAGSLAAADVLARLGSTKEGLAEAEAVRLLWEEGRMRRSAVTWRSR